MNPNWSNKMNQAAQRFNLMRLASAVAGVVALGISATTNAANVGTSFLVQANVAAQCSVTAADLNFGAVNPTGGNVDQTTTVTVKCTKNSAYDVALGGGTVAGSAVANRLMANGADTMAYQLYKDAGRTVVWGDAGAAQASGVGAGMGTNQVLTVYGRVPTGQTNLAVGSYSEPTMTVTVTY